MVEEVAINLGSEKNYLPDSWLFEGSEMNWGMTDLTQMSFQMCLGYFFKRLAIGIGTSGIGF